MNRRPGTSQDQLRRHNISSLLWQVHLHGAISRAELTSLLGLNRSTIKGLVDELDEAGLVREEIPETRLGAGRPSHVVVPRAGAYVLAASIGDDSVALAAVGLGGVVLARREYRVSDSGLRPQVMAGRLASELRKLQARVAGGAWLVGVGIGVPGTVRRTDGQVELAPNLGWSHVGFGRLLAERFSAAVPLQLGNDADLGALAEHLRGAARGLDNLVFLVGEVGLGGGLIVDGRQLRGVGGYAGEIGHLTVNPVGRRCRCGNDGCLETEVGGAALLVAAGLEPDAGRSAVQAVLRRAEEGEPVAVAAVERVGCWLGRAVAMLVNVFNPELVILGDVLGQIYQQAQLLVLKELDRYALGAARQQVRLALPALGGDAVLLGAAELAFEGLLHDPADEWWSRSG